MTWIGLRDAEGAAFRPAGLDAPPQPCRRDPHPAEGLLAAGTLQLEIDFIPGGPAVPLVHYAAEAPWPVRLSLFVAAGGVLTLRHRVGARVVAGRLAAGLTAPAAALRVTYGWDAPARCGRLSLYDPDTGRLWQAGVPGPMPLGLRDARRLMTGGDGVRHGHGLSWLALADHLAPVGPMPGLDGAARLSLADGGLCRLDAVRPGAWLRCADGGMARVLWAGGVEVPARGRLAPMRLRAPFYGLQRDIVVARHQRLLLAGSDVEYQFGVETVSAAAGHLCDGRSVLPLRDVRTRTYWQVLLDRPAAILAEGCAVRSFTPGGLLRDPEARAVSVLGDLPDALSPDHAPCPLPLLRRYEALTLAHVC